jgi:hypothetical protein
MSIVMIRPPYPVPRAGAASRRGLGVVLLALCAAGCTRDPVHVELQSQLRPNGDGRRLDISAQVTGPQSGLRYKWFSVSGDFEPQVSDWPSTTFRFAPGALKDRVTLEVWRDNQRIATSELDVRLDEARLRQASEPLPRVLIEITRVPPYEPEGGPDTHADISGRVSGELSSDYKVVTYARADVWYIQPSPQAFHPIRANNTWGTWTHTGSSYAALVVRPGFDPIARLDVLPQVGGAVLARAIVDGRRQ